VNKRRESPAPAAQAGRLSGTADGLLGKLCGARERFMRERPAMPESEYPAYRDAYNAAMAESSRTARAS